MKGSTFYGKNAAKDGNNKGRAKSSPLQNKTMLEAQQKSLDSEVALNNTPKADVVGGVTDSITNIATTTASKNPPVVAYKNKK
tara:strand:+ start:179 stop:427 length:249 start_codon:yes stop_codon:yes gene_type:complete